MPFDADLVFEALRRVAADPAQWDDLLDALPPDAGTDKAPHPDLGPERTAAVARREQRPGEGEISPGPPGLGWLAFSARGRVLAMNDAASEAMEGLAEVAVGREIDWRTDANRAATEEGLRRTRAAGIEVIVRLERTDGEPPVFALASPLSRLPWLAELHGAEPAGACLVLPAVDPAVKLWAAVRESFGLTEAEVRLARKLREGLSLQQAADSLGVSVNTVRNQLRGVFEKMGVQRQSDLVRALTELAGLNTALRPAVGPMAGGNPAPPVLRVELGDGRRLAYREYGPPAGAPVVFLHEGLGSSLLPPGSDALARALGVRLIAPERPGFGLSDPRSPYGLTEVADDVAELCARLGVARPVVGAALSGCAFAVHLAARLKGGARRVMIVTGRPPGRAALRRTLFAELRARMQSHPWLAESLFAIVRMRRSPALAQRLLHRAAAHSSGDQSYLQANGWIVDYVYTYVGEALARTSRGPADDLRAIRAADDDRAPDPGCPVEVWHGAEDQIAPLADLLAWLGPAATEVREVDGVGHFLAFKHWDAILRRAATLAHDDEPDQRR